MLSNFIYSHVSLTLFAAGVLSIIPKSNRFTSMELYSRFAVVWVFILIFGLRTIESGPDTLGYRLFFDDYVSGRVVEFTDIGFLFFAMLVSFFTDDSKIFTIAIFSIQLILLFLSLKGIGVKNISLFLIAFVFTMPGFDLMSNTVRQGLSVSLGFLAFSFFLKGRTALPILLFLSAALVHVSSVVYFLIFFLKSKLWCKVHSALLVLILVVFIMSNFFDTSVAEFLHSLSLPGFGGLLINKLYNYEAYNDGRLSGIYKAYFFIIYYIPILVFVCHKQLREGVKENRCIGAAVTFYLLVMFIYALISKGTFSFRLLYVIYPILIYILSQLYFLKGQKYRIAFYCCLLVSGLLILDSSQMIYFTYGVD